MRNTAPAPVPSWWRGMAQGLRLLVADAVAPWRHLPELSVAAGAGAVSLQVARLQYRDLHKPSRNELEPILGTLLWMIALVFLMPGWTVVGWCLATAFFIAAAMRQSRQFAKAQPPDEALRAWEVRQGRLNVLAGIVWGSVGWLFPAAIHEYGAYLALGELMVIAGTTSQTYRPANAWLSVPLALLTAASLVVSGTLLNLAIAAVFLGSAAMLWRLGLTRSALVHRTLCIAQERVVLLAELEAQRAAAEQAHRAKGRFLSRVGHDLCQPMRSITLLTDSLRQGPQGATPTVHQITAAVRAVEEMLTTLLDVSRLEDGTLPLQMTPFAASTLLSATELQFTSQAGAKGLDFQVLPSAAWLHSDPYQVQRMLSNLVTNAIRYTARGRVLVRCRVRGTTAWLQVWDSGVGIACEDRRRVFDEFVQVRPAGGPGNPGLGLGLSIVQRVAQRLGHPVVVRSRLQRGSMFAIGVPLDTHSSPFALSQPLLGVRRRPGSDVELRTMARFR